jgi:hypothetical protein
VSLLKQNGAMKTTNSIKIALKYSGVALQMLLIIAGFHWLGTIADEYFQKQWITNGATLVGVFLAMGSVIIQVIKDSK